ncbi:MAG TPA: carboxymuconolactone decarboxylase family protein [Phycisphaerae bacterium]|nr:carboxymuconolactone decarboxylase family protein [Phycisphaerae bacterium]
MEPRANYIKLGGEGIKGMYALEKFLHGVSVEQPLVHLVKLRASQVNGCAYCIDMHWKDLRALGETEQRLYGLDAWEESPYYTPRERAALRWTEELTHISKTHASEAAYAELKGQFSEQEIVDLTFVISTINAWNRLAIGFRSEPGKYISQLKPRSGA